jgi:predicted anti-sigma-YlaC factor YlaD
MRCEDVKNLIRNGRYDLASRHLDSCDDCRAFAEDFGELAGFLSRFEDTAPESDELLRTTLSIAAAELKSSTPAIDRSKEWRTALAAGLATLFAPVLILLNYVIAMTGQMLIAKWLPPVFGNVFFAAQALGAIISISIAYGSLPLIMAAARDMLRSRSMRGGITA